MLVNEITKYFDENGEIEKAKVLRYDNSDVVSTVSITIGSELVVANKRLKHFERKVKVINFKKENENNEKYGLRVNVKFLDNGRRGIIFAEDLDVEV